MYVSDIILKWNTTMTVSKNIKGPLIEICFTVQSHKKYAHTCLSAFEILEVLFVQFSSYKNHKNCAVAKWNKGNCISSSDFI